MKNNTLILKLGVFLTVCSTQLFAGRVTINNNLNHKIVAQVVPSNTLPKGYKLVNYNIPANSSLDLTVNQEGNAGNKHFTIAATPVNGKTVHTLKPALCVDTDYTVSYSVDEKNVSVCHVDKY